MFVKHLRGQGGGGINFIAKELMALYNLNRDLDRKVQKSVMSQVIAGLRSRSVYDPLPDAAVAEPAAAAEP